MKFTKSELTKVCEEYRLGKIKSLKTIKGGWVNYNYLLGTQKGKFVVRLLGYRNKEKY